MGKGQKQKFPKDRLADAERTVRDIEGGNYWEVARDALRVDLDGYAWLSLGAVVSAPSDSAAPGPTIRVRKGEEGFTVALGRYSGPKWDKEDIPREERKRRLAPVVEIVEN